MPNISDAGKSGRSMDSSEFMRRKKQGILSSYYVNKKYIQIENIQFGSDNGLSDLFWAKGYYANYLNNIRKKSPVLPSIINGGAPNNSGGQVYNGGGPNNSGAPVLNGGSP